MLRIGKLRVERDGSRVTVAATLESRAGSFELYYRLPAGAAVDRMEPFLIAGLLPAMRRGEPLEVEGPVSPRLVRALPTVQDIYHCWDPSLRHVPVTARRVEPMPTGAGGAACFFSGGLDSFHSALTHRDEITALVHLHSFGFPRGGQLAPNQTAISASLRAAAEELGLELIEIDTNLREILTPALHWTRSHGLALASAGLFLAPFFRKMYISAGSSYAWVVPAGVHSMLDPRWNTEAIEFIHDGLTVTRLDKAARIAQSGTALRHLRVCANNGGGVMNCGVCEKCLRTMIELHLVGALDRCTTFAQPLAVDNVARMQLTVTSDGYAVESLQALEARGTEPELAAALRQALDNYPRGTLPEQHEMMARVEQELASTRQWAQALEAAAIQKDQELARWRRLRGFPLGGLSRLLAWRRAADRGPEQALETAAGGAESKAQRRVA